jgi:NAD(P)-dependent dehydrogenase (short-subunit alcohol dehydrogenase family)
MSDGVVPVYAGKVVVVTGAGRGLGREHALAFAALGARVVVNDYSVTPAGEADPARPAAAVVDEICAAGGEAVADGSTVATTDGAREIFRTAMDAFGRVDVLVNNAGFLRDRSFGKMTDDEWSTVLGVHLDGAYHVTHACWDELRRNAGAVLFTTSHGGLIGQFGQANYAAAKSGLVGLTRTLAIEGHRYGLRVNAVAPIATTRLSKLANERLRAAVADFDPRYVAALATFVCAGEETGGVFMAGHGTYSRFLLMETEPLRFDHVPTIDELGAAWPAIDGSGPLVPARMPSVEPAETES